MPGSNLLEFKWAKMESFFQSPKARRASVVIRDATIFFIKNFRIIIKTLNTLINGK